MKREVFTEKIFMLALIAVLYFIFFFVFLLVTARANEQLRMAYISDSPGSSAPYWIAKEAGFYKKYGLDVELIFINGSTRGIQSLIAGDLDFAGAVGTSAINGKLDGWRCLYYRQPGEHAALLHHRKAKQSNRPRISKDEPWRLTFPVPRRTSPCVLLYVNSALTTKIFEAVGRRRNRARRGGDQWPNRFHDGHRAGKAPG